MFPTQAGVICEVFNPNYKNSMNARQMGGGGGGGGGRLVRNEFNRQRVHISGIWLITGTHRY